MKRRSIFAALAAFFTGRAMAQEYTAGEGLRLLKSEVRPESTEGPGVTDACFYPHPRLGCIEPKPNQCPVCGTMAEPYKRELDCVGMDVEKGRYVPLPCGPADRVTRCKRCNAAFWQDAEGEAK